MKNNIINIIQGESIRILELSLSYKNYQIELLLNIQFNNKKFYICFYNISRLHIQNLSSPMEIYGFEIICNKQKGWDKDSNYQIHDFEDDRIGFFCEDYDFYTVD